MAFGETATDTFSYTVDDGQGGSDTAVVTVTINGSDEGTTDPDQVLIGGNRDDVLIGGTGNDTLILRLGEDSGTGGAGADTFRFDGRYAEPGDTHTITDLNFAEGDIIEFRAFAGRTNITSQADLQFYVDNGFASVTPGSGGALNVTMQGFADNFGSLDGTFIGSRRDDVFNGGAGNDSFNMRLGDDTATGGGGADTFIFDGRYAGNGSNHTIVDLDFSEGDVLALRRWIDGSTTEIGDAAALAALDAESWASVTTTGTGTELELTNSLGETLYVSIA
ncbi:Ig-like domain-containing protein [Meridianimarinicoccus aquatilis]|uniref:Calcium-binding protein n=1 Tax=Meridianimarinicoccus aquatilis TaxID=2552766 RepID=A0A4R6B4Z1_9RHOB|nr:hypothetical protein [Fluviibacterium aquatile]TDL90516.1 hypothetical protein E2L05_05300 [Fluviibacterium aquatile]